MYVLMYVCVASIFWEIQGNGSKINVIENGISQEIDNSYSLKWYKIRGKDNISYLFLISFT